MEYVIPPYETIIWIMNATYDSFLFCWLLTSSIKHLFFFLQTPDFNFLKSIRDVFVSTYLSCLYLPALQTVDLAKCHGVEGIFKSLAVRFCGEVLNKYFIYSKTPDGQWWNPTGVGQISCIAGWLLEWQVVCPPDVGQVWQWSHNF